MIPATDHPVPFPLEKMKFPCKDMCIDLLELGQ